MATAGVSRGSRGLRQPRTPTAPGLCQVQPTAPQQRMPTQGRHEAGQATPYRQQVYPPRHTSGARTATTKASTIPSTSQGRDETARGGEDTRGRSSSRGPQGRNRRDRSSTRGSRKRHQGIYSDNPMDDVSNYVASGWKPDLTHIISCYWVAQVSPLDSEEWEVAIQRFLKAMKNWKASEWVDIKELSPLKFMPYVAELFQNITSRELKGLSDFMGWVGISGYYHWKPSELGQLGACPCLQGQPVPDGPIARPSGRPHPRRPAQTGASATGASGRHQDGSQPTSDQGGNPPTSNQGGKPPQGVQLTCPWREKEQAMARCGMNGPSGGLEGKRANPKALHTRLGPRRPGGRLSARFTIMWLVKSRLPATSPQRLFEPITPESRLKH